MSLGMTMFESARRIVRMGVVDWWRNGTLSLSATAIVGVTLFIVAVFTLQVIATRATARAIQNKLDMAVYLSDGPSEDEVSAFVGFVRAVPGVKTVAYLNKDEVMAEWQGLSIDERIKSQVTSQNNPLPRTIKIKTDDPNQLDTVAAAISGSAFAPNIRNLSYRNNRPVIQTLNDKAKTSVRNGGIVSGLFGLISILFLYHTIRLMIHFRADEIRVMKLVGATNAFVSGPLLIEGILYGLFGGLLAFGALWLYIRNGLTAPTAGDALVGQAIGAYVAARWPSIAGELVGLGVMGAAISVWLSLGRHLKGVKG